MPIRGHCTIAVRCVDSQSWMPSTSYTFRWVAGGPQTLVSGRFWRASGWSLSRRRRPNFRGRFPQPPRSLCQNSVTLALDSHPEAAPKICSDPCQVDATGSRERPPPATYTWFNKLSDASTRSLDTTSSSSLSGHLGAAKRTSFDRVLRAVTPHHHEERVSLLL